MLTITRDMLSDAAEPMAASFEGWFNDVLNRAAFPYSPNSREYLDDAIKQSLQAARDQLRIQLEGGSQIDQAVRQAFDRFFTSLESHCAKLAQTDPFEYDKMLKDLREQIDDAAGVSQ